MICDKCKAQFPDSALSCPECGSKAGSEIPTNETKTCPKCGAVNPAAAKFCMEDGFNFEEAAKPPGEDAVSADVKFQCPMCGTRYPDGIKFCRKDGMPLEPINRKAPEPNAPPAEAKAPEPSRGSEGNAGMEDTIRLESRDSAAGAPTPKPEPTRIRLEEKPADPPQPLKEAQGSEVEYSLKCPMCGTKYPDGIKFCRKDGMPLEPINRKAPEPNAPPAETKALEPSRGREENTGVEDTIRLESRDSVTGAPAPKPEPTRISFEGEPAAPPQPPKETGGPETAYSLRCPMCGTKYPDGIKFCRKDGMPLEPMARKAPEPNAPPVEAKAQEPSPDHAKEEPEDGTIYVGSLRNPPEPQRAETRGRFHEETEKISFEKPASQSPDGKPVEGAKPGDTQPGNTVRCPRCGTMNPEGAPFCMNDGTVLKEEPVPAEGGITEERAEEPPPPDRPANSAATEARSESSLPEEPAPQNVQALEEAKTPEADYTVRCPKCGTMNPEEANFCRKDGTPLKGKVPPPSDAGVSAPQKPEKSPAPMRASAPATKAEKPKKSRTVLWIVLSVVVLVLACAGGLFYYKGFSGMKPEAFQATLNEELKRQGLNVTAQINKDWTATLQGSVRQQGEKDLVLATVKAHKEVKGVTDNTVFERTPAVVQADIEKGLAERGLTAVQAQVDENFVVTLAGTVNGEDEKTAAMDIVRGTNGVKEVQNMVAVKVEQQKTASSAAAEAQRNKSKEAKAKAAAAKRDSSKMTAGRLESEINRALRNAGISSVSAEVKDDMGVVVKGTVRSAGDKQQAMQIVQGFRQARSVRDIIFVVGQ